MQAPLDPIVPRKSADGLFNISELRDFLMNTDFLLRHLPAGARRFGAGDDLARFRDRRQRELDALLRETVRS